MPKVTKDRKKYRNALTSPLGIDKCPWPTKHVPNAICLDEVGRGALMGPMCIGACVILDGFDPTGIHDSKKLREHEREAIFERVKNDPHLIWHVEYIPHDEIDEYRLSEAWNRGMIRAIEKIRTKYPKATHVIVDGNAIPHSDLETICEPKADSVYIGVALAAIMAKVVRDRYMVQHSNDYGEEFRVIMHNGKGYTHSKTHMDLIHAGKATPIHRKSFAPYRDYLIPKLNLPK